MCCHGYRPYHPMGALGTCQIYEVSGNLYVFIPQVGIYTIFLVFLESVFDSI